MVAHVTKKYHLMNHVSFMNRVSMIWIILIQTKTKISIYDNVWAWSRRGPGVENPNFAVENPNFAVERLNFGVVRISPDLAYF